MSVKYVLFKLKFPKSRPSYPLDRKSRNLRPARCHMASSDRNDNRIVIRFLH